MTWADYEISDTTVKYKVSTSIDHPLIIQEVTGIYDSVQRRVIDTSERQVIEALVSLGWTPPDEST